MNRDAQIRRPAAAARRPGRRRLGRALVWVAAVALPLVFAGSSLAESGNHDRDRPSGGRVVSVR